MPLLVLCPALHTITGTLVHCTLLCPRLTLLPKLLASLACVDFPLHTHTHTHAQVTLNITRALAPLGVDRLHALVADHFFDGAAFFRVDGGFVLQFGIAGTPAENAKWVNSTIKDDPVVVPNMVGELVLPSRCLKQCLPKDACAPSYTASPC